MTRMLSWHRHLTVRAALLLLAGVGVIVALTPSDARAQVTRTEVIHNLALYGGVGEQVTFGPDGALYVGENGSVVRNGAIYPAPFVLKLGSDGRRSFAVAPGRLRGLTGLAVDNLGNLFVGDGGGNLEACTSGIVPNDVVWKFDASGNQRLYAAIRNPMGLVLDAVGGLYVASYADNAVYRIPPGGGSPVLVASGFNASPNGLAIDRVGNVYVAAFALGGGCSAFGTRIYRIKTDNTTEVFFDSGGLFDPHSLAFDSLGNLYASYYNSLKILRIAPDGSRADVFPGGGTADDAPNGIAIDASGALFVTVNGGYSTRRPALLRITGIVPASP